jgi:hypothetical protein
MHPKGNSGKTGLLGKLFPCSIFGFIALAGHGPATVGLLRSQHSTNKEQCPEKHNESAQDIGEETGEFKDE